MNSDFANTSINKTLSEHKDKELLNGNITQNITKQDEKNLRDEYDKENELNNNTDDDILSLVQDYSEEEKNENKSGVDSKESYYDNNENSEMEDTDEDLLALLDMISAQDESNTNKNEEVPSNNSKNKTEPDYMEEEQPLNNDILSIDDLPTEISDGYDEEFKEEKSNNSNDMGGIFSDVLSAVDSLQDKEELSLNNANPVVPENEKSNESKKDTKLSFWQKILGKKNDTQDEKSEQAVSTPIIDKKAEKKKAEKLKKVAEPKKNAKKEKLGKVANSSNEDEKEKVKNKKSKAKPQKAKNKPEKKKAVKKVKKEPTAKTAKAIEDSDDNIKINKLAVIFVMTFFILIGGFVILGTNLYSYSLDIKNANLNFSRQRYTEAYNEIYGLDIRKNDSKIYKKIMTVMFVNKELNSYNNYIDLKMYPEALDSLLKGIERYDKYIKEAKDLGIKSDMDNVKKQILTELKKKFNISEEEAVAINSTEDQTKYSINVINTVLEKMK
jgi:hypothetical protein